jgi:hypothetical protein
MPFLAFPLPLHYYCFDDLDFPCFYNVCFVMPCTFYEWISILVFILYIYRVNIYSEQCQGPQLLQVPCTFCEWISILVYIHIYRELKFTQSNDRILLYTCYHWIIETSSQHELIMVTVCSSMMEVGRVTENHSPPLFSLGLFMVTNFGLPPKKRIFFHNFICF